MNAEQLAQNVFEFIRHNGIDTSIYTMDEIVEQYFIAQLNAIDDAAKQVAAELS